MTHQPFDRIHRAWSAICRVGGGIHQSKIVSGGQAAVTTRALVFCALLLAMQVSGCDQFNQKPAPVAPPPPPPPPPVVAVATPAMAEPEPPPMISADDVIDEFLDRKPSERTDDMLIALSELDDGLNRIKELDLTKSPVTEAGLQVLSSFPRLKVLNLTGCQISNNALRKLPDCQHLEVLILADTPIDSGAMVHVGQLAELQELSLAGTALSDAGFVSLKGLKNLEVLQVDNNPNLTGREFGRLVADGAFSQLRELTANNTRLSTNGIDSISKLPLLEVFEGRNSGLTDALMVNIGKCTQLRVLNIGDTPITSSGMKRLAKLDVLEELDLSGCRAIADIAFNYLKANKSLRKLNVTDTSCTLPAVQLLANRFLVDTEIYFNNDVY